MQRVSDERLNAVLGNIFDDEKARLALDLRDAREWIRKMLDQTIDSKHLYTEARALLGLPTGHADACPIKDVPIQYASCGCAGPKAKEKRGEE